MGMSLKRLREVGQAHLVEDDQLGFTIARRGPDQAEAFNHLVRTALDEAGNDYVAFPRSDGAAGYESVFIVPLS